MTLDLTSFRSSLEFFVSGNRTSVKIIYQCSPSERAHVLYVGAQHAFGPDSARVDKARSQIKALAVSVCCKCDLTAEDIERLGLGIEKIGHLSFYSGSRKEDEWPQVQAAMTIDIYVEKKIFDSLKEVALSQRQEVKMTIYPEIGKFRGRSTFDHDGYQWDFDDADGFARINL